MIVCQNARQPANPVFVDDTNLFINGKTSYSFTNNDQLWIIMYIDLVENQSIIS